jgi:hypothetical protein
MWFEELAAGRVRSFGATRAYRQALRWASLVLAFVAPTIVEAISQGHQPAELIIEMLPSRIDLRSNGRRS